MKATTLLLLTVLLVQNTYGEYCSCEPGQTFIDSIGKCSSFPLFGQKGYISNCRRYTYAQNSQQWNCSACIDGYFLYQNTENFCISLGIDHCKSGKIDQEYGVQCTECLHGYYLQENKCEDIEIPNCLESKFNNKKFECTRCDQFHYLLEGKCYNLPKFIPKCQSYAQLRGENLACAQCIEGYFYEGGKCQTTKEIASEKLDNCLDSYVKPFRLGYANFICSKCKKGYSYASLGAFDTVCEKNPEPQNRDYVENCENYGFHRRNSSWVCTQCSEGFILNKNQQCIRISQTIENCKRSFFDSNNKILCQECKSEYYPTSVNGNIISCRSCPSSQKQQKQQ